MKSVVFTLFLLAVIAGGCSKSSNKEVGIKQKEEVPVLAAKFSVTNTINNDGVKEGDDVRFENQSILAISYLWDFGNGTTSTDKTPTSVFGCGQYSIKLTITGTGGATAVVTKNLLVYCKGKNAGGRVIDGHVHTGNTGD